jgi:hypothetical protein
MKCHTESTLPMHALATAVVHSSHCGVCTVAWAAGGHKAGWHRHGAGRVAERLRTAFEDVRDYFEGVLGLGPGEWVALLGAHTVGRVAGLDPG